MTSYSNTKQHNYTYHHLGPTSAPSCVWPWLVRCIFGGMYTNNGPIYGGVPNNLDWWRWYQRQKTGVGRRYFSFHTEYIFWMKSRLKLYTHVTTLKFRFTSGSCCYWFQIFDCSIRFADTKPVSQCWPLGSLTNCWSPLPEHSCTILCFWFFNTAYILLSRVKIIQVVSWCTKGLHISTIKYIFNDVECLNWMCALLF